MKLESLLLKLAQASIVAEEDMERGHMEADQALLDYINNPKVKELYDEIVKSY